MATSFLSSVMFLNLTYVILSPSLMIKVLSETGLGMKSQGLSVAKLIVISKE